MDSPGQPVKAFLFPSEKETSDWGLAVGKLTAGFLKLLETVNGTQVFLWRGLEIPIIPLASPVGIWFWMQEAGGPSGGRVLPCLETQSQVLRTFSLSSAELNPYQMSSWCIFNPHYSLI